MAPLTPKRESAPACFFVSSSSQACRLRPPHAQRRRRARVPVDARRGHHVCESQAPRGCSRDGSRAQEADFYDPREDLQQISRWLERFSEASTQTSLEHITWSAALRRLRAPPQGEASCSSGRSSLLPGSSSTRTFRLRRRSAAGVRTTKGSSRVGVAGARQASTMAHAQARALHSQALREDRGETGCRLHLLVTRMRRRSSRGRASRPGRRAEKLPRQRYGRLRARRLH